MDDTTYQKLASQVLRQVEDLFEDIDAEDVDYERAGDVLTLTFKSGKKCVLNTQRPTRQMWLAAGARAWHFSFDAASGTWLDDKGQNIELLAQVRAIVLEFSGLSLPASA
jgi:CyaY protein